jgi:hypothetical protein
MQPRKTLPLFTLSIILAFSLIIWFYPPTADFKVDNPFWNGLETFDKQENANPIDTLSNLPDPATGTTLVIIPYTEYTETELTQIKNYVTNGGTLVLLDDYGYGNQILSSLGAGIQFSCQQLIDPLFDYHTKTLPKITDFTTNKITANVSSILFNHATTLEVTNAKTVAYSSSFSFLDGNNNQVWEENEKIGPLPVIAYQQIGQGYVIAIADPSLLINSMITLDDNQQLINNAITFQSSNPEIYIEQSHLASTTLDQSKAALNVVYQAATSTVGTILLVTALLAVIFYPIIRKVKK